MAGTIRHPLRIRILLWAFIPTAIILSAVAITIYVAYQRVTADLVVGRNQQLTHLSANQLAADLRPDIDALTTVARNPDIYAGESPRKYEALAVAADGLLMFDG